MGLSPIDWHTRFVQQAEWTRELRNYLFKRASMQHARRVLDLGCGTGALSQELINKYKAEIHCLDIAWEFLDLAISHARGVHLTQGDAHSLPYSASSFDIVLCHFVILWLSDPYKAVEEMARVTRLGGLVLAIAEPDYGGRLDYPDELAHLGKLQQQALQAQGADPLIGRRLAGIFSLAGLEMLESGVIGSQWKAPYSAEERQLEWEVLEADLKDLLPKKSIDHYRRLDSAAWERGERVLFVPTFFALGRKHS